MKPKKVKATMIQDENGAPRLSESIATSPQQLRRIQKFNKEIKRSTYTEPGGRYYVPSN